MFFFNRTKQPAFTNFEEVELDMHSHLVPGVDDGSQTISDSITLITGLRDLGFKHLITTPHTLLDIHPNTKHTLKSGYDLLAGKTPSDINLSLSSEYYLDEQFQQQLNKNELMPFKGNRVLIEFSQISQPNDLEEVIFDLVIKGYQPVLAHPERYLFFHQKLDYFKRLKEMSVELQINALSLTLHYGKNIKAVAEKLIEKELIDFIGTDIHHVHHLTLLKEVPKTKHFERLMKSGNLKNKELIH